VSQLKQKCQVNYLDEQANDQTDERANNNSGYSLGGAGGHTQAVWIVVAALAEATASLSGYHAVLHGGGSLSADVVRAENVAAIALSAGVVLQADITVGSGALVVWVAGAAYDSDSVFASHTASAGSEGRAVAVTDFDALSICVEEVILRAGNTLVVAVVRLAVINCACRLDANAIDRRVRVPTELAHAASALSAVLVICRALSEGEADHKGKEYWFHLLKGNLIILILLFATLDSIFIKTIWSRYFYGP